MSDIDELVTGKGLMYFCKQKFRRMEEEVFITCLAVFLLSKINAGALRVMQE